MSIALPVTLFATALIGSLLSASLSGIFADRPAFFKPISKALSELTFFNPRPGVTFLATYDLPDPGPPAMKNALNIPGS